MLRLRPTVVTLAMAEITAVEHRRRFQRYLESDGARFLRGVIQDQTDAPSSNTSSPSNALSQELAPRPDTDPEVIFPVNTDTQTFPFVGRPPVELVLRQRGDDGLVLLPELSGRELRWEVGEGATRPHSLRQHSLDTPSLSVTPRRRPSYAAFADAASVSDHLHDPHDSLGSSSPATPVFESRDERSFEHRGVLSTDRSSIGLWESNPAQASTQRATSRSPSFFRVGLPHRSTTNSSRR